jgi:diguanylate cyclase (GGDEF)-like protein
MKYLHTFSRLYQWLFWMLLGSLSQPALALEALQVNGLENGVQLDGHFEIWHDPDNLASLAQARQALTAGEFGPLHSKGSTGLKHGAYWSHFTLANTTDKPVTLDLEYVDHQLIYLSAYQRTGQGGVFTQVADLALDHPFAERPVPHHRFVVPIEIPAGASAEFFFRFGSHQLGYVFPSLRIWSPENLQYTQARETWLMAFLTGGLALMALISLVGWIAIRETFFAVYCLYALSKMAVWPTIMGFTHAFWLQRHFHWSYMSLAGAVTIGMGIWFARVFLQTRTYIPRFDYILRFMFLNVLFLIGTGMLKLTGLSLLSITIALLMTPMMAIAGAMRWRQGARDAAVFTVAWTFMMFGLFLQALRDLGFQPHTFINYYWPVVASYLEIAVMMVAMGLRLRRLRQKKEVAERRYTQQLEKNKAELEALVFERTRDLEEAKSVAEREARTDSLTGTDNRRSFMAQAEGMLRRCRHHGDPLNILMFDIDHFKRVNDTYGHGIGDLALIEFARAIRKGIRDIDVFGRLGGEEFALAMTGPRDSATATAERLRQAISHIGLPTDQGSLHVTTSIGVAHMQDEASLDELLALADAALYRAKQSGRNRVECAIPADNTPATALTTPQTSS